ncbi:MAG: C25 family cysteine peptidase, partial [Sulfuricaulis sp.]|nr:C25 family cysteine peptidase [Sulfuricaulis sp.]
AQLNNAAKFKSGKRNDYLPYFGISAEVWQKSTALSVDNIFGSDAIKLCPPTGTPGVRKSLAPLAHFINCHGGSVDTQFYGQHGETFPVSMDSDDVTKGAKRDTVVAAECCYGAQLFDPAMTDGTLPIANAYLGAGAAGYFGSTTIAYGPSAGNGAADLLTQYFLINMLAGASLGRACLQARQKFVQTQKMADPVNLKTLGQFILLADPSIQPCLVEGPDVKSLAKVVDFSDARKRRRIALTAFGHAAADSSGFPGKKVVRLSDALHKLVRKVARQRGFRATKKFSAFHVVGGDNYSKAMKASGTESKVMMLTEQAARRSKTDKNPESVKPTHILVAHAHDGHIIDIAEYFSR